MSRSINIFVRYHRNDCQSKLLFGITGLVTFSGECLEFLLRGKPTQINRGNEKEEKALSKKNIIKHSYDSFYAPKNTIRLLLGPFGVPKYIDKVLFIQNGPTIKRHC